MKKSKSVFSLFLTLALVLSLLPALSPAARAEDPVSGLFHYQLNADGQTVTITNDVYYLFTAGTQLTIPSTIEGYTVTAIGEDVFKNNDKIAGVVIPDSVTSCGKNAFYYCSKLTSVQLGTGLADIPEGMFCMCRQLTQLTVPDSVRTIGKQAFYGNSNLASVSFGSGLRTIGSEAFSTDKIAAVTLPESLTSIGDSAFLNNSFDSITIPAGVSSIGQYALDSKVTIYGHTGSQAETFAASNGNNFVSLDSAKPVITKQPVSVTVEPGGIATFTAAASGATYYHWAFYDKGDHSRPYDDQDVIQHTDCDDFDSPKLVLGYVTDWFNDKELQFEAHNSNGSVYSDYVTLTVTEEAAAVPKPTITTQPVGQTGVKAGTAVTLSVTATGSGTLSYQWYQASVNDLSAKKSVPAALSSTYTVPETSGTVYYCVGVTNTVGGKASDTVYSDLVAVAYQGAPVITVQPTDRTGTVGGSVTFTVTATGDDLSYEWFAVMDSKAVSVAKTTHGGIELSDLKAEYNGLSGYVIVTNSAGSVKSNSVTLTVKEKTAETMPDTPTTSGFTDVASDAYYTAAVAWAVDKGVTSGTSANTFSPDAACDRAQTVTFLWRATGKAEPSGTTNPFTDVAAAAYYYKPVLWAAEKGVTTGSSATTFSPVATVTRAAFVTFLWRAAGKPAVSGAGSFTDVTDPSAYYYSAVAWAVSKGITTGTSATTFSPDAPCTRAQVVTFLYRYFK